MYTPDHVTYTVEIKADNKKTKSLLRMIEMKLLRIATGYTCYNQKSNIDIREECGIPGIVKWG